MSHRFFAYYKSLVFNDHGQMRTRTMGGRKMKYHHDIEVVCKVAQYNLGRNPMARAYVFEVFPVVPGHVLTPPPGLYWNEVKYPTRLELVATVPQSHERFITLTERAMGARPVDQMDAFLRERGHRL